MNQKILKILKTILNFNKDLITTVFYILKYGSYKQANTIFTHITYNLGDNLTHIQYLKKCASIYPDLLFIHFCKYDYVDVLNKYLQDTPSIKIDYLKYKPHYSINAWKNFNQYYDFHPEKNNFVFFYLKFFENLSMKLGMNSPMNARQDFIFNLECTNSYKSYDWFVVNSKPLSGQFNDPTEDLTKFIISLSYKFKVITTQKIEGIDCTKDLNLDIVEIGKISTNCNCHLMISTGPSWLALNQENCRSSNRIYLLIDKEKVDFSDNMECISDLKILSQYIL